MAQYDGATAGKDRNIDIVRSHIAAVWRIGKILLVMLGSLVLLRAMLVIGRVYEAIPSIFFKGTQEAFRQFIPVFQDLVGTSFAYLWLPILLYVLIACLTSSPIWRRYWYLVGVAWFFLRFVFVFEHFPWPTFEGWSWSALKEFGQSLKNFDWEQFRALPLVLMQGYIFALWALPREFWNIIGLVVSILLGLVVLILPDLPTTFDDFGIFGAILAFFLGYINALASLLQRSVDYLSVHWQRQRDGGQAV